MLVVSPETKVKKLKFGINSKYLSESKPINMKHEDLIIIVGLQNILHAPCWEICANEFLMKISKSKHLGFYFPLLKNQLDFVALYKSKGLQKPGT